VDRIGKCTERARDNDTAESVGTLLVGDDCEIHPLKIHIKCTGTCEM